MPIMQISSCADMTQLCQYIYTQQHHSLIIYTELATQSNESKPKNKEKQESQ